MHVWLMKLEIHLVLNMELTTLSRKRSKHYMLPQSHISFIHRNRNPLNIKQAGLVINRGSCSDKD